MFSFAPQTVAIVPDAVRIKLTEVTPLPSQADPLWPRRGLLFEKKAPLSRAGPLIRAKSQKRKAESSPPNLR